MTDDTHDLAAKVLEHARTHDGRLPAWLDLYSEDEWDAIAEAVRQIEQQEAAA
ncbi:MAG: hypothetical protein J5I81_06325 [Nitrococcus mobilis]|nr:hypothetical protein [Nitrococcus mobilis]